MAATLHCSLSKGRMTSYTAANLTIGCSMHQVASAGQMIVVAYTNVDGPREDINEIGETRDRTSLLAEPSLVSGVQRDASAFAFASIDQGNLPDAPIYQVEAGSTLVLRTPPCAPGRKCSTVLLRGLFSSVQNTYQASAPKLELSVSSEYLIGEIPVRIAANR